MTYVGHLTVADALRRELPPIALLQGPQGVGKWTLTDHLVEHYTVNTVDRFDSVDPLTAEVARAVIAFVTTYPMGAFKVVRIRLDRASAAALRVLLKTLEEPPASVRFLLTASAPTLATIASRSQVFRFGLLTADQVRQVLLQTGLSPTVASRAARTAHGRVDIALAALSEGDATRTTALTVLRAVAMADRELYLRATRTIDADTRDALVCWLSETLTGRFVSFAETDTVGLGADRDRLRRILATLLHTSKAHPRLSVRTALDPFFPHT